MSHRSQQVESTLKRVISRVLTRKLSDPRIVGMVSVTHVDVSPDARHALVYVSVLPDKYQQRALHGLRHAAGRIRAWVCKEVAMRVVPRLEFRLDDSLKKQAAVLDDIQKGINQDRVAVHPCQAEGDQVEPGLVNTPRLEDPIT